MNTDISNVAEEGLSRADLLWTVPLLLGLVQSIQGNFGMTADMGLYMNQAVDIANGKGYSVYGRGPGFPGMMAIALIVFGHSVNSAIFVVQLFTALNVVLVYFVARAFYDRTVGLVASVLFGTAPVIYGVSLRHIDVVIAFFLVLSILATYVAFTRRTSTSFALAGLVFGLSYMVKAQALLVYPLPVLLFLHERYRRPRDEALELRTLATLYGVTLLTVLPWVTYIVASTGSVVPIFGKHVDLLVEFFIGSSGSGGQPDVVGTVTSFVHLLGTFVVRYLYGLFFLWFAFIIAWIHTVYRAKEGDGASITAVLAVALLSPMILYEASVQWRISIVLPFYLLTFAVTGALLVETSNRLAEHLRSTVHQVDPKQVKHGVVIVVVVLLVTPQVFVGWGTAQHRGADRGVYLIGNSAMTNVLHGDPPRTRVGGGFYGHTNAEHVAEWLATNSEKDTPVLIFPHRAESEVYFRSQGSFEAVNQPYVEALHRSRAVRTNQDTFEANDTANEHILFISSLWSRFTNNNRIRVVTQEDLLAHIENSGVEYVVTMRGKSFLQDYLGRHPQFTEVHRHENVVVFSPDEGSLKPIEYKPRATSDTSGFLLILQSEYPEEYEWYRETVLEESFGLNESQIAAIESGEFDPYFEHTNYRIV